MPRAEIMGDVIAVETKWTEKELIKSIPGSRWAADEKIWTVPRTWAACLQLRGVFGATLEVGEKLAEWSWSEFETRVQPSLALREKIDRVDNGYDLQLYDFQTAGAEFMFTAHEGLLGDDLGMGKTAQILAAIERAERDEPGSALPALVICPNTVKTGWEKQIHKWKINANPYVVTGGAAGRRKIIDQARKDPRAVVITNIESVRLLSRLAPFGSIRLTRCRVCDPRHGQEAITPAKCEVHQKELNNFGFRTVILDEAHRCKDPSSKQTRACWAIAHHPTVNYRWALTGTPIANHVGDLWAIMHFLSPSEYPTKSRFVDRYGLQAWNAFGGMDIVGINPEHREEFYKILDARFRRTAKALVLRQLPRVVRMTRWVNMSAKQAHAYTELERRLITRLESGEVLIAPNNLVNATRLLQLSSSYCDVEWVEQFIVAKHMCKCGKTSHGIHVNSCPNFGSQRCWCHATGQTQHDADCPQRYNVVVTLTEPSPKLDAMMEDLESMGDKPVIIAAMSRQLIELAGKRLDKAKISHGYITGAVDEYTRQITIQRFRANQIRVVLMTIGAGGTGVDGLQHADTMICLQRSWSMIENVQVDGRVDRIGSEKHDSVTIIDYVTRGTIEETTQHPRLIEKYERLEEINRDRERLIAAGVTPNELLALDERESRIVMGHLGVPTEDITDDRA